jgi:hypothetical protein
MKTSVKEAGLFSDKVERKPRPSLMNSAFFLIFLAGATATWAGTTVDWKGGEGNWENAAMWGGTLPSRTTEARINGTRDNPSQVTLAKADVLVNHVSVAEGGSSLASLILDGPSLSVSGSFDVGKYTGSDGRLVVKSGHLFVGTIFVSGGGGAGMRGRGTVEIHSGSLVTKDIELGASAGCSSTLRIVGSKAAGIVVEDGLRIGVYNYLKLENEPPPSATELVFDIDADGYTWLEVYLNSLVK